MPDAWPGAAAVTIPAAVQMPAVMPAAVRRDIHDPMVRRRDRAGYDDRPIDGSGRIHHHRRRGRTRRRHPHDGRFKAHGHAEGNAHAHARPSGKRHGDQCDGCDGNECFSFHTPIRRRLPGKLRGRGIDKINGCGRPLDERGEPWSRQRDGPTRAQARREVVNYFAALRGRVRLWIGVLVPSGQRC